MTIAAAFAGIAGLGSLFQGFQANRAAKKEARSLERIAQQEKLTRQAATGLIANQEALLEEISVGVNARLDNLENRIASPITREGQFDPFRSNNASIATIVIGVGVAYFLIRNLGK